MASRCGYRVESATDRGGVDEAGGAVPELEESRALVEREPAKAAACGMAARREGR